jgi:hypothetical protein
MRKHKRETDRRERKQTCSEKRKKNEKRWTGEKKEEIITF